MDLLRLSTYTRCLFSILIAAIFLTLQIPITHSSTASASTSKIYVVYMGTTNIKHSHLHHFYQMLTLVHGGSIQLAQASHVCSYTHSFTGFAAKLTQDQALEMTKMPGVVSVFPNAKTKLHTTHSWDFMGLATDEQMEIPGYSTKNQHNVIIAFIDTGIWPESPSFSDHNMPPVPSRWRGQCQAGEAFNASSCNRKVIGARYYLSGFEAEEKSASTVKFRSPRDANGHGSHTASIAAGQYVMNMNFKGLAAGGARGGAPMARIAVYKTCWDSGCYDVDLLAAFDDAIKDGVDIISLSLGPDAPQGDYFNDAISIGSFHAANRGILVVSSVGNEGSQGSATNLAPWLITVAASSTDRDFTSNINLGDGTNHTGESLSLLETNASTRIIAASEAYSGYFTPYQSSYCLESSLNSTKISGNIVVCRHTGSSSESKLAKSLVVKEAGGVGLVLVDEEDKDVAIPFLIPAAIVGTRIGERILSYINHTRIPTAHISTAKTVIGSQPAPRVASFSSKGPNALTPAILKPDVTAPGLNILAAWSPAIGNMDFNILSGTSMACPHVTGIAALIKAVYPSWSPSAIKSAIMTTATMLDKRWKRITVDPTGRRGTPFDYGAGFVNPTRVLNPGLVYDSQPLDYKKFLCSIGYNEKSLHLITRDKSTCNQNMSAASDLNYPSITVSELRDSYSVTRTVTNVGQATSTYRVLVSSPAGVKVSVSPRILIFKEYGQKMNFTVNFKVTVPSRGYVFGLLAWKKGKLRVSSPLVVRVVSSS
ncbi:Subtilisin-like protease SBT1.6 [Thalictrum thalictroides]|uniref:Subtilisin-like protease SBT1.6 n=1 Tax=Thalictrum thalictroides TaxID=46969 RepID=A0A7J6VV10_THATH|nr:Subtilisin-like protease SBT1.6 [Thalictrum thalictroides]